MISFFSAIFHETIFNDTKVVWNRLEEIFYECQKEDQIPDELGNLLSKYKKLNNEETAKEINKYLYEKYDQKDWLVLVYNGVSGFDNHKLVGKFHFSILFLVSHLIHCLLSMQKSISLIDVFDEKFVMYPLMHYRNRSSAIGMLTQTLFTYHLLV